jgi:hypothetical protein
MLSYHRHGLEARITMKGFFSLGSTLLFVLVSLALTGCQTTPPPAPGMSTLRLSVVAEPKTGVATADTNVSTYDEYGGSAAAAKSTGPFEHVDYDALDDIVVWIEPAAASATAPVKVDIDPFHPANRLSAVAGVGGSIIFHNITGNSVNLYSVSDGNDFDLGSVSAGSTVTVNVKSPGLIEVLTDSQKDPLALIYAAPSPQVHLTRAGQTVEFRDLAPGNYHVHSWHPRLPGREITVTLLPDQITNATIKVGVNDLPKIINEPRTK